MDTLLDVRAAHKRYEDGPERRREAVDAAYTAAREALQAHGYDVSNTDPAEELVGAITIYVEKSNEGS